MFRALIHSLMGQPLGGNWASRLELARLGLRKVGPIWLTGESAGEENRSLTSGTNFSSSLDETPTIARKTHKLAAVQILDRKWPVFT